MISRTIPLVVFASYRANCWIFSFNSGSILIHRQVVLTMPKMLRVFFKYNRKLLGSLCLCGKQALRKYLQAAIGKEITPWIISVIQSVWVPNKSSPTLALSHHRGRGR